MDTLACTAPEVMLARIGAETERIRIGSGGIMLPHYAALKVAEQFRMLHALYPAVWILGLDVRLAEARWRRWPCGGSRRVQMQDDFADQTAELLAFLDGGFPARASVCEDPGFAGDAGRSGCVDAWIEHVELGGGGGVWAAVCVCALLFSRCTRGRRSRDLPGAVCARAGTVDEPEAMVAVGVICAETQEEAELPPCECAAAAAADPTGGSESGRVAGGCLAGAARVWGYGG